MVARQHEAATSPAVPRECAKHRGASARDERRVKLQQFLVMKAFNLRRRQQTLFQQFAPLKRVAPSRQDPAALDEFLELDELCAFLGVPPFRRVVLVEVFALSPPLDTRVGFNQFVRFLQSAAAQAARDERELRAAPPACSSRDTGLPSPPPHTKPSRAAGLPPSALVCFQPTLLSSQPRFAHPPPAPGLWKKREVTVQERTTEYTKIDELGRPQRLVEKERHQSEVIHMESLAGEFAHREITQFEQTEHLNGEMVHFDSGREEFLHLKSQHDEVSRFDSSAPGGGAGGGGGGPDECEQPPPSPTIKRDPSAFVGRGFGSSGAEAAAGDGEGHETAPEYEEARRDGGAAQEDAVSSG